MDLLANRCVPGFRNYSNVLGVADRATERVERLSGGLQRRVEIAKAVLHSPRVLLLDEPTSGLDVAARRQLNDYLAALADTENILVLLTTHLLDDAEACNRVGILDTGKLVALGAPDKLKAQVGGDVILIECIDKEVLCTEIAEKFGVSPVLTDNHLRVECERGHEFVRDVVAAFPDEVQSVRFGKPTLEDVFIKLTGNSIHIEESLSETISHQLKEGVFKSGHLLADC